MRKESGIGRQHGRFLSHPNPRLAVADGRAPRLFGNPCPIYRRVKRAGYWERPEVEGLFQRWSAKGRGSGNGASPALRDLPSGSFELGRRKGRGSQRRDPRYGSSRLVMTTESMAARVLSAPARESSGQNTSRPQVSAKRPPSHALRDSTRHTESVRHETERPRI